MSTKLTPYIEFNGNAREAMEFYKSVFGGQLNLSTYQEYQMSQGPNQDNKIMHAELETDNGMTLMGADAMSSTNYQPGNNISVTLSGDDRARLSSYYEKLSAGGTVIEPLEAAPWGDLFGMCVDRFGVKWMVNISGQRA